MFRFRSSASDEALLPDVKVKSSPRRSNRENLPLLRPSRQRHNSYDDIDVECNNFSGESLDFLAKSVHVMLVLPQAAQLGILFLLRKISSVVPP